MQTKNIYCIDAMIFVLFIPKDDSLALVILINSLLFLYIYIKTHHQIGFVIKQGSGGGRVLLRKIMNVRHFISCIMVGFLCNSLYRFSAN